MVAKSRSAAASYHHGDLRTAALRAARTMLEERGPSFLNVREIARRSNVSAPALYHHFPNKEAIALGLVEQGAAEVAEHLVVGNRTSNNLLEAGEAYVNFALKNPALYRLMFGEGFSRSSHAAGAVRGLKKLAFNKIKNHLGSRMDEPALTHTAFFLWSLAHGLSLLLIDGHTDEQLPRETVRNVLKIAAKGFKSTRKKVGNP